MNDQGHRPRFHLEINSLEDFAIFCAILRGTELDDDKLRALTAQLRQSTTVLSEAERADAGTQHGK